MRNPVRINNGQFTDGKNLLFFRGISIAGGGTAGDKNQSTIEYPFTGDIRQHLRRLRKWGFNLVRLPVTWEAIEPEKPGKYDSSYVRYVKKIVVEAGKEGMSVQLVFYQNGWSRFTGTAGAPLWTLEKTGFDGAKLRQLKDGKDDFHRQLAVKTMFTAFFGGRMFFPQTVVDGKNIQDFLQDHFIKAASFLFQGLGTCPNLTGFDFMSHYNEGFAGSPRLDEFHDHGFGLAVTPTPFQLITAGSGISSAASLSLVYGTHGFTVWKKQLNSAGINLWRNGTSCIYRQNGIWDLDPNGAPMLLHPEYFYKNGNRKINFHTDMLLPFLDKMHQATKKYSDYHIFYEEHPDKKDARLPGEKKGQHIPSIRFRDLLLENSGIYFRSLFIHPVWKYLLPGEKRISTILNLLFKKLKKHYTFRTGSPLFISETGIRFNLKRTATIHELTAIHELAIDRMLAPLENNFLSWAIWNYSPNGAGDSIYHPSMQGITDDEGGRGTRAFSRPYAVRTNGIPVSASFDFKKSLYKLSLRQDSETISCEIFLPPVHYAGGVKVIVNAGTWTLNKQKTVLYFKGEKGTTLYGITILPAKK